MGSGNGITGGLTRRAAADSRLRSRSILSEVQSCLGTMLSRGKSPGARRRPHRVLWTSTVGSTGMRACSSRRIRRFRGKMPSNRSCERWLWKPPRGRLRTANCGACWRISSRLSALVSRWGTRSSFIKSLAGEVRRGGEARPSFWTATRQATVRMVQRTEWRGNAYISTWIRRLRAEWNVTQHPIVLTKWKYGLRRYRVREGMVTPIGRRGGFFLRAARWPPRPRSGWERRPIVGSGTPLSLIINSSARFHILLGPSSSCGFDVCRKLFSVAGYHDHRIPRPLNLRRKKLRRTRGYFRKDSPLSTAPSNAAASNAPLATMAAMGRDSARDTEDAVATSRDSPGVRGKRSRVQDLHSAYASGEEVVKEYAGWWGSRLNVPLNAAGESPLEWAGDVISA